MTVSLKCRKCRHQLVFTERHQPFILSAHGEEIMEDKECCSSPGQDSLWFIEESATPWILDGINKAQWTKGRLNCPSCNARIGSFDFVSRLKCACGSHVLPPVHLAKSKCDSSIKNTLTSQRTGV